MSTKTDLVIPLIVRHMPVPLVFTLWCAVLLAGCSQGPTPPTLYPANGKVQYRNGQPMTGGMVEFRSTTQPELTTVGAIGQDGSFSLNTLFDGKKLPGATEGTYRVTVMPPLPETQDVQAVVEPIVLQEPMTVEPKEGNYLLVMVPANP